MGADCAGVFLLEHGQRCTPKEEGGCIERGGATGRAVVVTFVELLFVTLGRSGLGKDLAPPQAFALESRACCA